MGAGDKEITVEVTELELATELIAQLERARTSSAGVLRTRAYTLLGKLGVDVHRLVADARVALKSDYRLRARRALRRRQIITERVARENLQPEDRIKAERALTLAPRNIAAHKRALQDIMNRPAIPEFEPTFERHHHAAEPISAVLVRPPDERWTLVKRFNWPVDAIADKLTGPEYEAAERLLWAYVNRLGSSKVGGYGRGGGQADPSRRLPLTPTQQQAGIEWAMWYQRVPRGLTPILENFVLEIPPRGMDKPMSRAEFGKRYGRCDHGHQARGVADGALKAACGVLAAIWAQYQDELETQRARIKRASENAKIRGLIAAGALSEAAREIQRETRAREAAAARGIDPAVSLKYLEGEQVRTQVFGVAIEDKRKRGS